MESEVVRWLRDQPEVLQAMFDYWKDSVTRRITARTLYGTRSPVRRRGVGSRLCASRFERTATTESVSLCVRRRMMKASAAN